MNGHTTEYGTVRVTGPGCGVLTTGAGREIPITFQESVDGPEFRQDPGRTFGLDGVADFDLAAGTIRSFRVLRITAYRDVPIAQALDELRETLGPGFDFDALDAHCRDCRADG